MNNTIIFLSLLILILSIMLEFTIKARLDLDKNCIDIYIYLFKLKIVHIEISLIGLYYKVNNSKKVKELKLILTQEETYLIKQIKKSVLDKLYYDDIIFQSKIGLGDCAKTAVTIGLMDLSCLILNNYLNLIIKAVN